MVDEIGRHAGHAADGGVLVRPATAADAAAMTAIYNHAVLHSTATFDLEPQSDDDRRRWLADGATRLALVAVARGAAVDEAAAGEPSAAADHVIGWASLVRWSERGAYDHTAEASVYIAPRAQRAGVGRTLGLALIEGARERGLHVLIAQICTENEAGLGLALALGYRPVGTLREVGHKFGRWLDVTVCQLVL